MANTKSALKRVRQNNARALHNKTWRTRVKTERRRLQKAIDEGDAKGAQEIFGEFASAIDRAARRKMVHRNAAARLKSEMSLRVNAVAAAK